MSGGASLTGEVIDKFAEVFGADIHEGYGLSETPSHRPRSASEHRLVEGRHRRGRWVVLRGHNVFAGYLGNLDATAAVIIDGWFRSGDLGTEDAAVVAISLQVVQCAAAFWGRRLQPPCNGCLSTVARPVSAAESLMDPRC